jgi:hypothetical protein
MAQLSSWDLRAVSEKVPFGYDFLPRLVLDGYRAFRAATRLRMIAQRVVLRHGLAYTAHTTCVQCK